MSLGIRQLNPLLVLINPVAGGGRAVRVWKQVESLLQRDGIDYRAVLTRGPGHATQLAANARSDGHGALVVLGGDGTVSEVAAGLMEAPLPLAILPGGRGNDLSRALGLPRRPVACWHEISAGISSPVDVGFINDRLFVNIVGAGLDAEVAAMANRFPRYLGGILPYMASLALKLAAYRNCQVKVEADDVTWEGKAVLVAVGIGSHYGGGFCIMPGADPSDGLLDVCVAGDISKLGLLSLIPAVLKGKHVNHPKFFTWRARKVKVEAERPLAVQADGEPAGLLPASFGLAPGALSVLGLRGGVDPALQG